MHYLCSVEHFLKYYSTISESTLEDSVSSLTLSTGLWDHHTVQARARATTLYSSIPYIPIHKESSPVAEPEYWLGPWPV